MKKSVKGTSGILRFGKIFPYRSRNCIFQIIADHKTSRNICNTCHETEKRQSISVPVPSVQNQWKKVYFCWRAKMGSKEGLSRRASTSFIVFEIVIIVLYAFFVRHESSEDPAGHHGSKERRNAPSEAFNVGAYAGKFSGTYDHLSKRIATQ